MTSHKVRLSGVLCGASTNLKRAPTAEGQE
jgi:hypothetical protein